MSAQMTIVIEGIDALSRYREITPKLSRYASQALNKTAQIARTRSSRLLREQVAFGARYLVGPDGKIGIKPASKGNLQTTLSASSSPRSLARFVKGSPPAGKRGKVRVEVAPGSLKSLPGAFLLKIRGQGGSENTLLAVRSPTRPRKAYKPRRIGNTLWSLYGPSVSQALLAADQREGIWPELEQELADRLEVEFLRLVNLDAT